MYTLQVYATYQVFKFSSRWTIFHSVQASPVPAVLVPILRRAVVPLAAVAVYVAQVPAGAALERRRIWDSFLKHFVFLILREISSFLTHLLGRIGTKK